MLDMSGKVAVITGAAKGIGKAIAEEMSKQKVSTVIVDFDKEAGQKTADEINTVTKSIFIQADVTKYEEIERVRNLVYEQFGHIDILVINAGISFRKTVQDISVEEWNRVLDVNLNGSFYVLKAFYDDIVKVKGKIIFITSGSGITGTGGGAHYAASKAAQHGLMRAMAKELGPYGVNVNAVAPRVIQTEILDELYPSEESKEELLKKIPINRIGQPIDIANITVFLSSEKSSYIHGQIILADGGRTF